MPGVQAATIGITGATGRLGGRVASRLAAAVTPAGIPAGLEEWVLLLDPWDQPACR
jgi:hypothetical protein